MFGIVIDGNGNKVEFVHIFEDGTIDSYELREGEQLVTEGWNIANTMHVPKWTGTEWIDENPLPTPKPTEPHLTEQELFNEQLLLENAELKETVQTLLLDVALLKGGDLNV